MRLVIVRHGPAGDKRAWAAKGKPDALRPLTERGREKMKLAAKGLATFFPGPALLVDSGLKRSAETADILAREIEVRRRTTIKELGPDIPVAALIARLSTLDRGDTVLTGHEPQLSALVAELCGAPELNLELKKGAACLLKVSGAVRRGGATLAWALAPAQLRRLAR